VRVTEGSFSTQRVRVAGHATRRREHLQRMEEEGVVPPRRRGARGRRANVEPQSEPENEQEYDDMDVQQQQQMEEEEIQEELEAMEEDMEDAEPQQRRTRKKHVEDPEPPYGYPGGPHDTSLLWRYHVHVARKASEGEVFITVKLTLICC